MINPIIPIILFSLAYTDIFGQDKNKVYHDDDYFIENDSSLNLDFCFHKVPAKVNIDTKEKYLISKENEKYYFSSDVKRSYIVKASVTDGNTITLNLTNATVRDHCLRVTLMEYSPNGSFFILIKVIGNKSFMGFNFFAPMDDETSLVNDSNRLFKPLRTFLKLNSSDFRKGREVRGYLEFSGICLKGCEDSKIDVKGNFKITIE